MVVCLDRCVTGLIMACVDVCLIHFGSDLVRVAAAEFDPAVFKDAFYFVLVSPSPGGPGEGTDCHLSEEIVGFGTISARIRGGKPVFDFDFAPKRSWVDDGPSLAGSGRPL